MHQTSIWPWLSCCGLPWLAIDFFIRFGKIQLQFYKCDILKFSIRFKHIIRLKLIILKFMFIGQYDNILQFISFYIVGFCSNLLYIYIVGCILSMRDKLWANGFKIYRSHIIFTQSTSERDLKFFHDPIGPVWFHLVGLSLSHIFKTLLSL